MSLTLDQILSGGGAIRITCCQSHSIREKISDAAPIRMEVELPRGWIRKDGGVTVCFGFQRSTEFDVLAFWPKISVLLADAIRPDEAR